MLIMGLTGMTYGMMLSTRVRDENEAIQAAMGTFFPVLLLSGVMWPIEGELNSACCGLMIIETMSGIPVPLVWLSYIFPTTWGAACMRSIMARGWSMDQPTVWQGFLIILAWELVFITLTTLGIRRTE